MRSRRFRLWLLLALAAGVSSCEIDPQINPQPPLPGSDNKGPDLSTGGSSMSNEGQTGGSSTVPSAGGGLVLDPSGPGTSGAGGLPMGAGGDNAADGGAAASEGGAGGATDAGGAAGAVDVGPH